MLSASRTGMRNELDRLISPAHPMMGIPKVIRGSCRRASQVACPPRDAPDIQKSVIRRGP